FFFPAARNMIRSPRISHMSRPGPSTPIQPTPRVLQIEGDPPNIGDEGPRRPLRNSGRLPFERINSLNDPRHSTSVGRNRRQVRARIENEIATRRIERRPNINPDNGEEAVVNNGNRLDNNPLPNNSFTLLEHIGMVGARNFFIPLSPTRSTQIIECHKRASFYLCLILIISGLLFLWNASVHPFHMMGRRFFVASKYQSMFLTDEDFYPQAAMLIVYLTCIISGFAIHYTNQPVYDHGFCMYLHSARALILVGFFFLIWHIWAHAAHYPNESFPSELESLMSRALVLAKGNINRGAFKEPILPVENAVWRDTQTVFKCCGIHSFQDWFPEFVQPALSSNFSKYVPRSCCEKLVSDSCEAMYVHKSGCLQAQLKVLNTEALWVINPGLFVSVLAHFGLYLILGRLFSNTAAITRDRRPFEPPPPTQIEQDHENVANNVPAL
ncbi:unnamed protein product, partial [Allacma fusca]